MKLVPFALLSVLLAAPALAQHEGHGAPPAESSAEEDLAVEEPGAEAMTVALGPYATTRISSGTAWQPEASPHSGARVTAGRWSLMGRRGYPLLPASGETANGDPLLDRRHPHDLCGRSGRSDGLPESHDRLG